jgi:hypothetical protein
MARRRPCGHAAPGSGVPPPACFFSYSQSLLIIAIAGGTIVHPVLFALAIVALVLFLMRRRGAAY